MRMGITNGNGAICDKCGDIILPDERIRLVAKKLSKDANKAYSGHETTIGKIDLCKSCYEVMQLQFIKFKKPRTQTNIEETK